MLDSLQATLGEFKDLVLFFYNEYISLVYIFLRFSASLVHRTLFLIVKHLKLF